MTRIACARPTWYPVESPMLASYTLIDRAADQLAAKGVRLDKAYERRDPREPHRQQKELFEDRLAKAVRQLFRSQQVVVAGWAEGLRRPAKASELPAELVLALSQLSLDDEAAEAAILMVLSETGDDAVRLFAEQASIGLDLALYQALSTAHIREHIGTLISGINQTTLQAVQQAVATYLEIPGMTLRDLVAMLPFGAQRAIDIARTEITQAYGEINRLAGEQLAREVPDVLVEETWFTNRTDNVCPVCMGLDGVSRKPGEPFIHRSTQRAYMSPRDTHPRCACWTRVRTRIQGAEA